MGPARGLLLPGTQKAPTASNPDEVSLLHQENESRKVGESPTNPDFINKYRDRITCSPKTWYDPWVIVVILDGMVCLQTARKGKLVCWTALCQYENVLSNELKNDLPVALLGAWSQDQSGSTFNRDVLLIHVFFSTIFVLLNYMITINYNILWFCFTIVRS